MEFLSELGFPVIPLRETVKGTEAVWRMIGRIGEKREGLPYDIDGAVVKLDSLGKRVEMGEVSGRPKWAIAYKYPPEQKETHLTDVVFQVGRTGVLTPKAIIEPVALAGTTVSVVLVPEGDSVISHIQDTAVRDSDTMSVTTEVADGIAISVEGLLDVRTPVSTVQPINKRLPAFRQGKIRA
jgi:DNA ligase (NAD+)